MNLYKHGKNETEITTEKGRFFYSYNTLVAAYVFGDGYYKTEQYYSKTTSRHINKWLLGCEAELISQYELDLLV